MPSFSARARASADVFSNPSGNSSSAISHGLTKAPPSPRIQGASINRCPLAEITSSRLGFSNDCRVEDSTTPRMQLESARRIRQISLLRTGVGFSIAAARPSTSHRGSKPSIPRLCQPCSLQRGTDPSAFLDLRSTRGTVATPMFIRTSLSASS